MQRHEKKKKSKITTKVENPRKPIRQKNIVKIEEAGGMPGLPQEKLR
jgi:hypothetical protein